MRHVALLTLTMVILLLLTACGKKHELSTSQIVHEAETAAIDKIKLELAEQRCAEIRRERERGKVWLVIEYDGDWRFRYLVSNKLKIGDLPRTREGRGEWPCWSPRGRELYVLDPSEGLAVIATNWQLYFVACAKMGGAEPGRCNHRRWYPDRPL